MDQIIGEVRSIAFGFAPPGWAVCNGALLEIAKFQALFSVIGTTYGGNGTTTFALPDLRGRVAVGAGHGPGLSTVDLGQQGGAEQVVLDAQQMPIHTHAAVYLQSANSTLGSTPYPEGTVPAVTVLNDGRNTPLPAFGSAPGNVKMAAQTVDVKSSGGSQPVPVRGPFLGLSFIIALEGVYPER